MFDTQVPHSHPLFTYYPPLDATTVGIISIPHSGEDIPDEFKPYLCADLLTMREDVDYKVHELVDIEALQKNGVGVMVAHVHRVCVDLNRSEENCVMFWKENTKGVPLIGKSFSREEEEFFIRKFHKPFFEIYESLIRDFSRKLKVRLPVVDLHSMPSKPTAYHMKQNPNQKTYRADFCVSDQHGKTCRPDFIDFFTQRLKTTGHSVAVNDPYIGGFVTTFVNRFETENIQIEINRAIYMDEEKKELLPHLLPKLKRDLTQVLIEGLTQFNR
jgi:N-formylglutamate deformylase